MSDRVGTRAVDRLTAGDLMQWQADVGRVPRNIGALLTLTPTGRTAEDLSGLVAARLGGVGSLGRRPVRPPFGAGGWVWVDDDRSPERHVEVAPVRSGQEHDLLAAAVVLTARRLPRDRSPWAAHVLAGPDGSAVGIVLVLHHALADGLAGLAMLGDLVDGAPVVDVPPPGRLPSRRTLVRDAWRRRATALGRVPAALRSLPGAWEELGRGDVGRAPRSALNTPTGRRREASVVTVGLADLRAAARGCGGTANDVLLVAATESLRVVQSGRGERLTELVVSVPVAVRDDDVRAATGNAVGATQIAVPVTGPLPGRVAGVSEVRRRRISTAHGRSLPLVLGAFRVLHVLGAVERYENRQRLVNTFVTSLHGPTRPITVGGAPVGALLPVVLNQGNATASFTAMSYAGRFSVVVTTDPEHGPRAASVAAALGRALEDLLAA